MARTPFQVEVLTPEGEVFNDEVEMVSTRTSVGSIGILANHQPLLGLLDPTELRLYKSESDVVTFAQGEGYVQVSDNHVLLLVEEAVEPDSLDRSDIERFAQGEGYIQVGPEGVLVLVEEAMAPGDLDTSDLQERLRKAEQSADDAEAGSEQQRRALRDKKRWEAFLRIAGS